MVLSRLLRRRPRVDVSPFLSMVDRDDPVEIEGARDLVTPEIADALLAVYPEQASWARRRAIVDLVQDHTRPGTTRVMLDFLRAPMPPGDEPTEVSKAVALGHLADEYDQFTAYLGDRMLLRRDVDAVLAAHGLEVEAAPPPSPAPAPRRVESGPLDQQLIGAAVAGDLAGVERLVAAGAPLDARTADGPYVHCSALMRSMMAEQWHVSGWLIDKGADVNLTRAPDGRSDDQTPLWWAAARGDAAIATRLLAAGARLDTPDRHGANPTMEAASAGNLEVLRLLAARGGDLHRRYGDGRTALDLATNHGHVDIVDYLLRSGADVDHRGTSGYTPLMLAAEQGPHALVPLFIDHGADVNAVHTGTGIYSGLAGMTPLALAISGGKVKSASTLLAAGADPNYVVPAATNWNGRHIPERTLDDLASGKRADRMRDLLRTAR